MTGTHGSLMGENQDKTKKTYPTVQLENFHGAQAIIRCSLATNEQDPVPHVHSLEGDFQGDGADYQDIIVNNMNDHTASFQGITIIHTGKKHVKEVLERRLKSLFMQEALVTDRNSQSLSSQVLQHAKELSESKAHSMDLHAVKLKFEALIPSETPGTFQSICRPVYSHPVCNLKATQTGDLRIVRIDKHVSCVTGNEEVFIFVEKVNKRNIKVRFFEVDEESGLETWHAFAEFSELDVHHQYAIAFKTPPYKDLDIESDVDVYLQLFRPQDQAVSEPKPFKYKPRDQPRKRVRLGIGATDSVDSFANTGAYRNSLHGSVIVSPAPQNLSKYGSSGSSDSASDSHLTPSLQGFYNFRYPAYHTPFVTPPKSVQSSTPDIQQLNPRVFGGIPIAYSEPKSSVPPRAQVSMMKIPKIEKNIPAISKPAPVEPSLSSEIDDYLLTMQGQSNTTQDALKSSSCTPANNSKLQKSNFHQDGLFSDSNLSNLLDEYRMPYFIDGNNIRYNELLDPIYPTISRGMENLKIDDGKKSDEETTFKGLDVAKLVGLSLGCSLRKFATSGDILPLMFKLNSLVALQDNSGDNSLHAALTHNQQEAFGLLLAAVSCRDNPGDILNVFNFRRLTPLHIAVTTNNSEAVRLLLQSGADSDLVDKDGNTCIHLASSDPSLFNCLKELLNPKNRAQSNAKFSLEAKNYSEGCSPLYKSVSKQWLEGTEILLQSGANPNEKDCRLGRTPLHAAVECASLSLVQLILKCKQTNPNIQAYDGMTPLHLAVMNRNKEICIELMRFGANPHISCYVPVDYSSFSDGSSDETDEEDSYNDFSRTPLEMAKDIPEIKEILSQNWTVEEIKKEENVTELPATDLPSTTIPSSCSRLDSGIDIDTSSSNIEHSSSKSSKEVLDEKYVDRLSALFHPQSRNFQRLMADLDFQFFRPVLANKENPAKHLFSNLPVSLRTLRTKLVNMQLKEAVNVIDEFLE
ncbi:hypothetical protein QYM36_007390 [Artemia franciscana]|nr:hypothetical protein QYM36_007390 [Artemia franciscana]